MVYSIHYLIFKKERWLEKSSPLLKAKGEFKISREYKLTLMCGVKK